MEATDAYLNTSFPTSNSGSSAVADSSDGRKPASKLSEAIARNLGFLRAGQH